MRSIYELMPQEIKEQGYSKEIIQNIWTQLYIKKHIETVICRVEEEPVQLVTLEGLVMAMPGMYVVTGVKGEKYVIDQDVLDRTYDKVINKENVYVRKKYPVIVEGKASEFIIPCDYANGGVLKGKAGDFLIQSMIYSKNIYPCDRQIFEETYIPYVDYLREKYGVIDEMFEEEVIEEKREEMANTNIFSKFIKWIKSIFSKKNREE